MRLSTERNAYYLSTVQVVPVQLCLCTYTSNGLINRWSELEVGYNSYYDRQLPQLQT